MSDTITFESDAEKALWLGRYSAAVANDETFPAESADSLVREVRKRQGVPAKAARIMTLLRVALSDAQTKGSFDPAADWTEESLRAIAVWRLETLVEQAKAILEAQ